MKFSQDVNFSNRLKVDCSHCYLCEYMQVISLGSQTEKYGVVLFKHLGEDLEQHVQHTIDKAWCYLEG